MSVRKCKCPCVVAEERAMYNEIPIPKYNKLIVFFANENLIVF